MTKPGRIVALACCGFIATHHPAAAAGCNFESQGEGRVSSVIDNRSFRLEDGREVRLAGLAPVPAGTTALAALIAGRDVRLRGEDDAPDRWGRQPAFVFADDSDRPIQAQLLATGQALVSAEVAD